MAKPKTTKLPSRNIFSITKTAAEDFINDDVLPEAAALAYYTALSFAPLLIIFMWMVSALGEGFQQRLLEQMTNVVGSQAGEVMKSIVDNADKKPGLGNFAGAVSLVTLLISAAGVFGQLQSSLNTIWNVKVKASGGFFDWMRKRLLSFGIVISLGFLSIVSLVMSAAIAAFLSRYASETGTFWAIGELLFSLFVFSAVFAVIFKFLPDVKIHWREVVFGSVTTAILFMLGKYLIGLYLGKSGVGSAYGAAGSLIVLLVWVYYSSLILFFGAELTQVRAQLYGRAIEADTYATKAS